jgi:trigger factor
VSEQDIDEVIETLRTRAAEKKEVNRSAKVGDEVVIDFKGSDQRTKEPVKGADGQSYPLLLGSDTFIPGFEANIVGMKIGETKSFTLTFPKDYGVKALQNRKVIFEVTVSKVQELDKPKLDNTFAAKVGPFKTVKDLRADITKQLQSEKQTEADRDYDNALLDMLADKTTVALPTSLVDDEINRTISQVRQNLAYRGQTWQEYLEERGQTEDEYRDETRVGAERRVKAGLALSEVADQEGITVTAEEFQLHMQLLKGQYNDRVMQEELEKPENARSILSSMLTEKTVAKLTGYASTAK